MAASFSLPTVLANLTAGNQPLSLIDGDFTATYNPLVSLNTFSNFYTDAGTANTYSVSVSSPQTVSQAAGLWVKFLAANSNTGASTFQVNALAVKNILNPDGSALRAGQIKSGALVIVMYDGTSYQLLSSSSAPQPLRSYLAGLTMSTAGASATMSIAAGAATDSTNVALMTLAASISKTTSAWVVGSGNGGLDTGAIANGTWYHFYEIMRPDTGVVDVLLSLSASAPTMPASYTLKRRIGAGLTNGSAQWVAFIQDGDYFRWVASAALEVNTTNPGTSAVTATLTQVPSGVNVFAMINALLENTGGAGPYLYISDLAATDEAPSGTASPLATLLCAIAGAASGTPAAVQVRTNTSAQIRYRVSASSANITVRIVTQGWTDRRGRDT